MHRKYLNGTIRKTAQIDYAFPELEMGCHIVFVVYFLSLMFIVLISIIFQQCIISQIDYAKYFI